MKTRTPSIGRSFIELALAQAAGKVGLLAASVYIARELTPANAGLVFFAQNLVVFSLIFGDLGLRPVGMRNVAEHGLNDRGYTPSDSAGGILVLNCVLALVIAGAAAVVSSGEAEDLIILFTLTVVPYALYPDWQLKGALRNARVAVAEGVRGASYLLWLLILLRSRHGAHWVPVAYGLSFVAAGAIAGFGTRGIVKLPRLRWRPMVRSFRDAMSLGFAGIAVQCSYYTGTFFLSGFRGASSIAVFVAAQKLALAMYALGTISLEALLPRIARALAGGDTPGALMIFRRFRKRFAIGSLVLAGIVCGLAGVIVPALYGPRYGGAIVVLQVLAVAFAIYAIGVPYTCLLVARGRTGAIMQAAWTGIAVNAAASVILVQAWGPTGAGLASVLTETTITALLIRGAKRIPDDLPGRAAPAQEGVAVAVWGSAG